ncbi:MAG: CvpA family protein [Patescibacteria group bacterium]|nr:CvpA family protein [Patescibacteria group bacterium]
MDILGFNLVDLGILVVAGIFTREGIRKGFFALMFELSGFVLGIIVALFTYAPIGNFLSGAFTMSRPFAKVLGFLAVWFIIATVLPALTNFIYTKIPVEILKNKLNHIFGAVPAIAEALLLSSFILSLAVSFPFPTILKDNIFDSRIGEPLVRVSYCVETTVAGMLDAETRETLGFITIGEGPDDSVDLGFSTEKAYPDEVMEDLMFILVNAEREAEGLDPLMVDESLVAVARLHGADMFRRGYFSHITPEGFTPADRGLEGGVIFRKIGENIAYAPDLRMAHEGLMDSPTHRANILSTEFTRIGIGIQNAGARGITFTQNFAD